MAQFQVTVSKEWIESGTIVVEADSEDEAREQVAEILSEGGDGIVWGGSNMEPGNEAVEEVSRV